jgi:hypothetical protein
MLAVPGVIICEQGWSLNMRPEPRHSITRRRGCAALATIGLLIVALLFAIGMGWLGAIDRKIPELFVVDGGR